MQAGKIELMSLLGTNHKVFKVPVYQRTYDWKISHCVKLVQDIFDATKAKKTHFTGSIVYLNDKTLTNESVALLIDGQQRLTTITIILKALVIKAKELDFLELVNQINDNYLMTTNNEFQKVFKLVPTEDDAKEFNLLMNERIESLDSSKGFYKNYMEIKRLIDNRIENKDQLRDFYNSLVRNITVIEIVLDKGIDDPQEIFESINSTGPELSKADLIRNFLLMSASEQDYLYRQYWKPLYKLITSEYLEDYIFVFLMYKTQRKINYNDIYDVFVNTYTSMNYNRESMLKELLELSNIYEVFIRKSDRYSGTINEYMQMFRDIDQTTMYPFFINVFLDFEKSKNINEGDVTLTEANLIKILKFFLNYHIKRLVCGSKSSSLRGFYVNLYSRIFNVNKNKDRYYDSIATYMYDLKTKDEVPSDVLFKKYLSSIDIYSQSKLAKMLLVSVENSFSKEKIHTNDLSLEHIMPQTLESNWVSMLGEDYKSIHEQFVHTLGNLTITGYNSDMSNKAFPKKLDILRKSKFTILNEDVIDKEKWTKTEIENRADRLSDSIIEIFSIDNFDAHQIRFEHVEEHDHTSEYNDIIGKRLYSFKFINMDVEMKETSYRSMLLKIIEILDSRDKKIMNDIASKLFNPWEEGTVDVITNHMPENSSKYIHRIRDSLYLVGGLSAPGCIYSIRKLMDNYSISQENFLFYTKTD
ncbi:MAG: DUF262 domain-containing HNH endonuclease family protein [Novosphingobium sp.]|nr:DUF262 domain-containing HNH endonuclease family protein [Novosphingobium sp.]